MQNLYLSNSVPLVVAKFLWQHRRRVTVVCLTGCALTLAYLLVAKREYQSEAKILIRPGRESTALDPTAQAAQILSTAETRESQVYAVDELLSSRGLAEKVVDRLGVAAVLEKTPGGSMPSAKEREVAIKGFQKTLDVSTAGKTSVVTVAYEAKDPEFAQHVLETLLDVARDEYLRIHRVTGSQEFFVEQSGLLKERLAELERRLRDLKAETGVSSLATQRDLLLKSIDALQIDLVRARADQQSAGAEVAQRRDEMKRTPELVVTSRATGLPQTSGQTLREKLYDLEVREREIAAKLTPSHPELVAIRNQLAEARSIFEHENVPEQVTQSVNSTHQAAELAVQERQASVSALAARTQSLEDAIAGLQGKLKQLDDSELDVDNLQREIELAQASYRKYAENLEEARINQALEEAKISSLNVMEYPTLTATPVRPHPVVILTVGFVLSLMAGVAAALLAEYLGGVVLIKPSEAPVVPAFAPHVMRRRDKILSEPTGSAQTVGNGSL